MLLYGTYTLLCSVVYFHFHWMIEYSGTCLRFRRPIYNYNFRLRPSCFHGDISNNASSDANFSLASSPADRRHYIYIHRSGNAKFGP